MNMDKDTLRKFCNHYRYSFVRAKATPITWYKNLSTLCATSSIIGDIRYEAIVMKIEAPCPEDLALMVANFIRSIGVSHPSPPPPT